MNGYKSVIKDMNTSDKFQYLMDNYKDIVEIEKKAVKSAQSVLSPIITSTNKALFTSNKDDIQSGVIQRTIIANTFYWMDSHDDVHVNGIFNKSIKERGVNKIYHLHDHLQRTTARVGEFSKIYEKSVLWSDLGVNIGGETTALLAETNIQKYRNESIFMDYLQNKIDQHSVGMQYIDMAIAINDSNTEYASNKKEWDLVYPLLGNKAEALTQGYFWVIKSAKLLEISAVLDGSNILTNTVENIEPLEIDTQKTEPFIMNTHQIKELVKSKNYFKI